MSNPISEDAKFRPGDILQDNTIRGAGRRIALVQRFDPFGPILPLWQVQNTDTGRKTIIREKRFLNNSQWSFYVSDEENEKS